MGKTLKLGGALKKGKLYVWEGTYAMVKAERPCRNAVAVIRDKKEVTCLIEESRLNEKNVLAVEPGWNVITFDMVLPFELVGFLAKVSGELAGAGVGICALSAYSTDHILVKSKDLERALEKLQKVGFLIERKGR